MNTKEVIVSGLVIGSLLLGNVYVSYTNRSLRVEEAKSSSRLLGVKASLSTLSSRLEGDKVELDSIKKDNGASLKLEYDKREARKKELLDQFYGTAQHILEAKKKGDIESIAKLKADLVTHVDLGEYREYEFLRGDDWTMVYYDPLPAVSASLIQPDVLGVVDGKGRTVAVFQLMYDDIKHKFQLASIDLTLEMLEPTDIYQYGSGEAGVATKEVKDNGN